MAVIMICNVCNAPRGKIVLVRSTDENFTKNMSKKKWIESGELAEDWNDFSYVFFVDDKTSTELQYLLEKQIDFTEEVPIPTGVDLYQFDVPVSGTFYNTLNQDGEYTNNWSFYEQYLITRQHVTE